MVCSLSLFTVCLVATPLFSVGAVEVVDAVDAALHENEVDVQGVQRSGTHEPLYSDAKSKMESQFLYLISAIAGKVDSAVESIKEDLTSSNLKTQSFGAALIAGGFKDSLADYIDNNRVPSDIITMPDVTYSYGYNIGYGFGFAGPFLLPSYLSDTNLDCSSNDFLRVVSEYGLAYGLSGNYKGEANICNWGIDAKVALHCVLQHSGDYAEAAEIGYLIDDAVSAGVAATRLKGY